MSGPPIPPAHLRRAVGPEDPAFFENPQGVGVFDFEGVAVNYTSVFDFGCGCGRIARQMMLQHTPPSEYLGVDLHLEAISWCKENITPHAASFQFRHLNAFNAQFNPHGEKQAQSVGGTANSITLAVAHSVFTHILEDEADFYLAECARLLRSEEGLLRATWFLFDKSFFPMMQTYQNALYINPSDPTNAVIYDIGYVERLYRSRGLRIEHIIPPVVRGFQWVVYARKTEESDGPVRWPGDFSPIGRAPPPDIL